MSTLVAHSDIDEIRERIRETGLTQIHIAAQIGITPIHLSYILNKKKDMTEDLRKRLWDYLRAVKS